MKLYKSLVSILLNGRKSWTLKVETGWRIQAFQYKYCKKILFMWDRELKTNVCVKGKENSHAS